MVEMRLIDSAVPDTELELYGVKFQTPIMTAALSHLGKFHPEMPGSMIQYAKGAQLSGAVHWIGMGSDEEFEAVTATGARTVRIIKPYAAEEKIYEMIRCAEKCGALAVGMDAYKALALGTTAVSVGGHLIPYIKRDGEKGVALRIREMPEELRGAMAYTGVRNLKEFDASVLHRI